MLYTKDSSDNTVSIVSTYALAQSIWILDGRIPGGEIYRHLLFVLSRWKVLFSTPIATGHRYPPRRPRSFSSNRE